MVMKLRLRSVQSKETIRISVPDSCTLHQLHQSLSQSLPSSSSSSSSSSSAVIRFSLNKKDELPASSSQDSLSSLGLTSGDLLYFCFDPHEFSPTVGHHQGNNFQQPQSSSSSTSVGTTSLRSRFVVENYQEAHVDVDDGPAAASDLQIQEPGSKDSEFLDLGEGIGKVDCENPDLDMTVLEEAARTGWVEPKEGRPVSDTLMGEIQETKGCDGAAEEEGMDIIIDEEGGGGGGGCGVDVDEGKWFSEPYFLRKVLREELGDDGSHNKRLIIAIHAVFLESGFVGFVPDTGRAVDGFRIPEGLPNRAFTMSLSYTLPELLGKQNVAESVSVTFRSLGHFLNAYGSLANGGSRLYRLCLDENRFGPTVNSVWGNCDKNAGMNENDSPPGSYLENEVFEFWKAVKEDLVFPLLIDLCENTGLTLPPCLIRLPTEIKLKILESLPGVDIARMECVCSELRYLASSNDLWKQKYLEEFGTASVSGGQGPTLWKQKFVFCWESKKNQWRSNNCLILSHQRYRAPRPSFFPYIIRDPDPFEVWPPGVIGGDYDRLPGLGVPSPFGQSGRAFPRFQMRKNFSPSCNLGGMECLD